MSRITRLTGGLAAALMLALAPVGGAMAADDGQGGSADGGQASPTESAKPVTDAQLEKFAAAAGKMQQVRKQYGRKMQQAEEKAKRKQLRKEGQQKMVQAIRSEGLKLAEYQRIGRRLQQDKELQSRLRSMMQEQRGSGDGAGAGGSG